MCALEFSCQILFLNTLLFEPQSSLQTIMFPCICMWLYNTRLYLFLDRVDVLHKCMPTVFVFEN